MYSEIRAIGIRQGNGLSMIMALLLAVLAAFAGSAQAATSTLKINSQPSDTTVYEGEPVKFVINATSNNKIRYTWYKNGKAVGKDSNTLSVSNPTSANAGDFTCKVADGVKTVQCKPFTFTVLPKPSSSSSTLKLVSQSGSATVKEGGYVNFKVSATSNRPISYTWKKDNTIVGKTQVLALTNIKLSDAGKYTCSATDGVKTVTCKTVELRVSASTTQPATQAVTITQQPSSQVVTAGSRATLSVTATGSGTLSYQWYFNGAAISGATSSTLTLASVTSANAGSYRVVVRNSTSSATSNTVNVSIAPVAQTGSALISWKAPTTRADGSSLPSSQIAGYDLYHSAGTANSLRKLTSMKASELSIVVDDLDAGTHYFALTTRDVNGLESARSATFSVNIR